jgi:hypothetical protein
MQRADRREWVEETQALLTTVAWMSQLPCMHINSICEDKSHVPMPGGQELLMVSKRGERISASFHPDAGLSPQPGLLSPHQSP